ncbi:MarR family winged helix-turn-helix transcriptional regulator [Paenibacillus sp. 32O-W]|uniref:MarR family winged helix-turn-helix transcriptional regulator n=1 Tax=Paenibacillus sp. 32O-W TaxID=1695218 RepID=UPI0011A3F683|nr:MarR family transcriptional regulator [Paenibacillus sp. 32O-W]
MDEYLKVMDQINQSFEQFQSLVWQNTKQAERLKSYHLTPQQELFMYYIIRNQPVTANQIAAHFQISKSAVSQVLPKLEEGRMITRRTNPDNRRESFIRLGERGEEYAELLQSIDEWLVRRFYSKVPLEDLRQVLDVLQRLVAASGEDEGTTKSGNEADS